MEYKKFLMSSIPLIFGIIIGMTISGNSKIGWSILTAYMILSFVWYIIADKVLKIKAATDKRLETQNVVIDAVGGVVDKISQGNKFGEKMFDHYYPTYIFIVNLIILTFMIIMIMKKSWTSAFICFVALNIYIIINQVWRKIKHNQGDD